jgi:uncharacterized heparinase superfamily protein
MAALAEREASMRAGSLASAPVERLSDGPGGPREGLTERPEPQTPARAPAFSTNGSGFRPRLWPQVVKTLFGRFVERVRTRWRGTWWYRFSYRGPITDRIAFHPLDLRTRSLDDADGYFRGRFRLCGETLEVKDASVFSMAPPSEAFAEALHGFEWLRHLEAASGDAARSLALKLAQDWLDHHGTYSKPAWQPEITARRFINIFAHGRFFLLNTDLVWRSRFFVSLRNQSRVLARTVSRAPEGLPRLRAAAGLSLAGLCLSDRSSADLGLKFLGAEIEEQILPDGGHTSRSPQSLIEAFHILEMVQQALEAAQRETHPALRGALDRMAPMVRFFRLGDGGLSVFHGGNEGDTRLIAMLLERDDAQGRPFGHAPHSAYQRLAGGRTTVLIDVGAPPPDAHATAAHASCLAFELCAGNQRLVVNCGTATKGQAAWSDALRATAAHSALAVADRSSATVLSPGLVRQTLGACLVPEPGTVRTRRSENAQGISVEAAHDYYAARFGLLHTRHLALSPKGLVLSGLDRVGRVSAKPGKRQTPRKFAIRFHIHPDVRLSLAQGGGSVILKLPNGEGWRFRCGGGDALSIEESVYFGGGKMRRCEQLVVSGEIRDEDVEIAWLFEQIGAR